MFKILIKYIINKVLGKTPLDVSFLKANNDAIQATSRYPLEILAGLVTRLKAKKFKEAFNGLLQDTWLRWNLRRD